MKRFLTLLAVGLITCALTACATSTTGTGTSLTPAQRLQAVAVTIDSNCTVGTPVIQGLIAVQTDQSALDLLTKFQTDAGKVCAVAASIAHPVAGAALPTLDLVGIKTYLDAQTPSLLDLVKNSSLDQSKKTAAALAITGATLAITMASLQQ